MLTRVAPLIGGILILSLSVVPAASAGPLLDSARRAAQREAERCALASAQGEDAARQHVEAGLWAFGGALNGALMVIAPGIPVLAHLDNARPPDQALVGVSAGRLQCFNNGYRRRAKWRRATAAWLGFAGGTAILLTWLATHDS